MAVTVARVHLHGVAELDRGLAKFSLVEVALAAFHVLLLAHIGVTRAADGERRHQPENNDQTCCLIRPHCRFSPCEARSPNHLNMFSNSVTLLPAATSSAA